MLLKCEKDATTIADTTITINIIADAFAVVVVCCCCCCRNQQEDFQCWCKNFLLLITLRLSRYQPRTKGVFWHCYYYEASGRIHLNIFFRSCVFFLRYFKFFSIVCNSVILWRVLSDIVCFSFKLFPGVLIHISMPIVAYLRIYTTNKSISPVFIFLNIVCSFRVNDRLQHQIISNIQNRLPLLRAYCDLVLHKCKRKSIYWEWKWSDGTNTSDDQIK